MTSLERENMILQWLPFSWRCCRRFRQCGILLDDLRQEAVIGLIHAVDQFDSAKGAFMPYASRAINRQLMDMCADQMRPYAITPHVNKLVIKVNRAVKEMNQRGIWNPSNLLISEQSGLNLKQVIRARSVDRMRVPSGDFPEDEPAEPIDVNELLDPLDPDERGLLIQRYGLAGQPPLRLSDLASAGGVTRECIRKRQEKVLDAIRWRLEA